MTWSVAFTYFKRVFVRLKSQPQRKRPAELMSVCPNVLEGWQHIADLMNDMGSAPFEIDTCILEYCVDVCQQNFTDFLLAKSKSPADCGAVGVWVFNYSKKTTLPSTLNGNATEPFEWPSFSKLRVTLRIALVFSSIMIAPFFVVQL